MVYLSALWQALKTFFAHLKTAQREAEANLSIKESKKAVEGAEQSLKEAQATEAERHKADEQVRGDTGHGAKLGKWMRD